MAGNLTEDQIAQLLEDEDDKSDPETIQETITIDVCDDEEISDCEEAEAASCSEESVLEADADSNPSSSSSEEEEEAEASQTSGFYRVKNRFKWSKNSPSMSRVRQHNIIIHLPGLKREARKKMNMSEIDSWQLLLPDDLIKIVCLHTNKKITEFTEKY